MKNTLLKSLSLAALISLGIGLSCSGLIGAETSAEEAKPDPRAGELLFSEDFEDGRERWIVTDEESWTCQEVDGNHVFGINRRESDYNPPVRGPKHIALIEDFTADSFVMTFRVRGPNNTGAHRDCCVIFNYQNLSRFYYAHLGAKPDDVSGQILVVDEAPRTAISENERKTPWTEDWHTVKLVRDAESGLIEIYFDDMTTPHLTARDTRFGEGQVGIGSFDDINDFDDIKVWSLEKAE
jgi:hypothetical protein